MTRKLKAPAAAELAGVSESLLAKLRMRGEGPAYLKVGKLVLYNPADVEAWLQSCRVDTQRAA